MGKKSEYKSLISTLANGSTEQARELLKKHGREDAKNIEDLKVKLAKLYIESPDKIVVEKEFAEIHPHSEFLKKYITPKPEKKEISVSVPEEQIIRPDVIDKKEIELQKVCACGCQNYHSGFDGIGTPKQPMISQADYVGMVGMLAVIGITFYVLAKTIK